ncbi:aldo/keto reductase [uncultured Amnibacterium sp.]|uniref:aldo/keto reductase n=1 Tax=uncultured Amnibacterium sp. TaxID=1631851 RepID=UPI0035CA527B
MNGKDGIVETGIGTSNLRSLGRRATIAEVTTLLDTALDIDVRYIDTADTYGAGSAERALGTAVKRSPRLATAAHRFRIITKGGYRFPDLPRPFRGLNQLTKRARSVLGTPMRFDTDYLERALRASRNRLGGLPIYAYCLHNPPSAVLEDGSAVKALARLRESRAFTKVGVSIDEFDDAVTVARLVDVDLLELPAAAYVALPRPVLERLRASGVEIVVNRVSALDQDPAVALRRLRTLDLAPHVAVVGTRNPAHLRANATMLK